MLTTLVPIGVWEIFKSLDANFKYTRENKDKSLIGSSDCIIQAEKDTQSITLPAVCQGFWGIVAVLVALESKHFFFCISLNFIRHFSV